MRHHDAPFVREILNLRPTRVWTFKKIMEAGSNNASMSVSKFMVFFGIFFIYFSIALYTTTYRSGHPRCKTAGVRQSCRKALPRLQ